MAPVWWTRVSLSGWWLEIRCSLRLKLVRSHVLPRDDRKVAGLGTLSGAQLRQLHSEAAVFVLVQVERQDKPADQLGFNEPRLLRDRPADTRMASHPVREDGLPSAEGEPLPAADPAQLYAENRAEQAAEGESECGAFRVPPVVVADAGAVLCLLAVAPFLGGSLGEIPT